jgi:hypothetical protein
MRLFVLASGAREKTARNGGRKRREKVARTVKEESAENRRDTWSYGRLPALSPVLKGKERRVQIFSPSGASWPPSSLSLCPSRIVMGLRGGTHGSARGHRDLTVVDGNRYGREVWRQDMGCVCSI